MACACGKPKEADGLDAILAKHPNASRDSLIPILQEVQQSTGYLPREAVIRIGRHLALPVSKIYGVATFYNQFRFEPPGKNHIQVCCGTTCHVKGATGVVETLKRELKIEPGQVSRDGLFSLEVVSCIGACGLAPTMRVGEQVHGSLTPGKVRKILAAVRQEMSESGGRKKPAEAGRATKAEREAADVRTILSAVGAAPVPDAAALDAWRKKKRREILVRPVITVGTGTCGQGAGAQKTLEAIRRGLEAREIAADVTETGCIGLCVEEPMVDVQLPGRARVLYGRVTADRAEMVLDAIQSGRMPAGAIGQFREALLAPWEGVPFIDEHPFFAPQTRWVLPNCGIIDPLDLEEYVARGGYAALAETLKKRTPDEVCGIVEKSGLRGRGGGGFPAGRKWALARKSEGDEKYLVCNADEGDPGAFMNRALMEGDPHRLVEGIAIAAYAIGSRKAFVYVRAEKPLAGERVRVAIGQARAAGFLGDNILDSGFSLDIQVRMGAGAFVCGEETALIHSIEGKRGMPRPRPPFPAVSGLFDKPTIINNVETLANDPAIL
ncbi:MAG: NADH-quinone oxidoreductase subunit NuoE [Planctomycetota bacterium]